jgi:trans-aconitate 2-methyltransferase
VSTRWDASTYARASDAQARWGEAVLDRLPLRGDETVLDAGCGSGGVTLRLAERLPRGRVIAVDGSAEMVALARETLAGARADVRLADLASLDLGEQVDAIFSNAVFHWIDDHDRLFARLLATLRPGGRLVAQCGGEGNLDRFLAIAADVGASARWSRWLDGFVPPKRFAGASETERRLLAAGFADVRVWLEPSEVVPGDPAGFVRVAPLRCHIERLPDDRREAFISDVLAACGEPLRMDFQRLNMDARRP